MTLDQLIAEVAAQPTQVKAFTTLMEALQSEIKDASVGNSPPPSVQSKYDDVFAQASGKANEILHAIEKGKPHLDPLAKVTPPPFDPAGPMTATPPKTFIDKPKAPVVEPAVVTSSPPPAVPSPFGAPAHQ